MATVRLSLTLCENKKRKKVKIMAYQGRNVSRRQEPRKTSYQKWLVPGGILMAIVLLFVFFPGLPPMRWLLQSWYTAPISWVLGVGFAATAVASWLKMDNRLMWLAGIFLVVLNLWIFVLATPFMLVGLSNQTRYELVGEPIPVVSMRDFSYAEALKNFTDQNPNSRFKPGDLDYVRGEWNADFSPSSGLNPLTQKSRGFFVYNPQSPDPVTITEQQMPYAESGWLWNSVKYFVHQRSPFSGFNENVIYVEDPETQGGYMSVVSLIKRRGLARVPYLAEIMLIHGDGRVERLHPEQAANDVRLKDVQILPEWLVRQRCLAFGWREGLWSGMIFREGRIEVQSSAINQENSPPFHMESEQGMMWYTPISPMGKQSMTGLCMDSSDRGGPVQIWQLPENQAYKGVDSLATEIKGVNRPDSINWLRVSSVEGGESRSGDTDIVELLPLPRREDGRVKLYMGGFVSTDPPTRTRFYAIIDAESLQVLQDVYRFDDLEAWLRGEFDLPVMSGRGSQNQPPVPTGSGNAEPFAGSCAEPAALSEQQLTQCIREFLDELDRR